MGNYMVKYISLMCVEARGCRRSDVWRVIFAEYVRLSGEAIREQNTVAHHAERCVCLASPECHWQMLMPLISDF